MKLKLPDRNKQTNSAESHTIATILIVALTIILVVLLFSILLSLIPDLNILIPDTQTPEYFVVITADAATATLKIKNIGPGIINKDYSIKFYVNDVYQNVVISTLNGHDFIPTHHFGVAKLYGGGPRGETWDTNSSGFIDISDGTFHSGDVLRVEVYLNTDNSLYSSTTYTCP